MPRSRFGMIPGTKPEPLKIAKTEKRAWLYAGRDPGHLLALEIRCVSLPYPPGFTPDGSANKEESSPVFAGEVHVDKPSTVSPSSDVVIPEESHTNQDASPKQHTAQRGSHPTSKGASVLDVMDGIIQFGQAMGYSMEGFVLWGNSNYDFVVSDSLGASAGILCIWEASNFKKHNSTISDNFIAIYGAWLTNNSKILFIVVYAPQQPSQEKILWEYILSLLGPWKGEVIIMGDFNEVRSSNERRGSCFNPFSARRFDNFILDAGLVDVPLEEWKEIPFNFDLTISNIERVDSESLDDGVTKSMNQLGIKEDTYTARTPIESQSVGTITNQKHDQSGFMINHNYEGESNQKNMINKDIMKITAVKVEAIDGKIDLPGYKDDHKLYKKS
nr:RNA-directed DNA polymerase, eukaryota [Tanacetum cinerariifolium]